MSAATDIEARLGLIEDRQAIHDVIVRYTRGVDSIPVESAFREGRETLKATQAI